MANTSNLNSTINQEFLQILNSDEVKYRLPAIIYTSVLMLIGTPGNIIVLYIYFFKWTKSTSRVFILFLTLLDLLNCVTTLPLEIYIMNFPIMLDRPSLCKVSRFATYAMNSSSALILVAIAVDRFKRICRPHGSQISSKKSAFICVGCIVFALAATWPSLVLYGTRVLQLGKVQGTSCLTENRYDHTIWPQIFYVFHMISTLLIFVILSVLYYLIGVQIYRHKQRTRNRRNQQLSLQQTLQHEHNDLNDVQVVHPQPDSFNVRHINPEKDDRKIKLSATNENKVDLLSHDQTEHKEKDKNTNAFKTGFKSGSFHGTLGLHELTTKASVKKLLLRKSKSADRLSLNENMFNKVFVKRCSTDGQGRQNLSRGYAHIKFKIGRSTLMLFLITLAYVLSYLPFYVIVIMRQTSDYVNEPKGAAYMMYLLLLRSYLLSSAVNPFIYSFCNVQFRTLCYGVFKINR